MHAPQRSTPVWTLGCFAAAAVMTVTGCQSQLGAVYGVATGKTTVDDILPANQKVAVARAQRAGAAAPSVAQAAFAPPPTPGAPAAAGSSPVTAAQPIAPGQNPLPEPTRDEAFALIIGDLQQIGAQNPTAQQELLRQLQAAEPGHWQSIVRRFRSTLAYQEQLKPPVRTALQPAAANASAPFPVPSTQLPTQPPAQQQPQPTAAQRPISAPSSPSAGHASHATPSAVMPPVMPEPPAVSQVGWDGREGDKPQVQLASAHSRASPPVQPAVQPAIQSATPATTQPMVVANPYRDEPAPNPKTRLMARPMAKPMREKPRDWRRLVEDAIVQLEATTPTDPMSTTEAYEHARLRLLHLVGGRLDEAVTPIPGLSPSEQDYWSKQLFAIATMLDHEQNPEAKRRAAAAGIHLTAAHQEMQQLAALSVRNLTFCDEVFAYGAYRERASRRFQPGEEVTLYVEVANFRSDDTPDGHHTVIGTSYQVLDSRGARVDGREFPPVDDYCLSPRRDFHIQYGVSLPERIYPGEYQLELTLTDQLGNKIGRASLDFEIVE